jgi:hypothetical protein
MKVVPPKRVSRSYTQTLVAPPDAVFPLLCPVREAEWIPGWDPLLVVSKSGVAEDDCVFVTRSEPENTVWYVTDYQPEKEFIGFVRTTPGVTACRLSIQLAAAREGSTARVTFTHTSLGEKGDAFVDGFTEAKFAGEMQLWEKRINHYLATGTCLAAAQ